MNFRNRSLVSKLAVGFIVLILAVLASAKQSQTLVVGKDDRVTFETAVRIGGQMMPPGDYLVQHVREGDDHAVTFRKISASNEDQIGNAGRTEIVRTVCKLKSLGTTAKYTELHYSVNEGSKTKTLQHLLVQGENVKHMF